MLDETWISGAVEALAGGAMQRSSSGELAPRPKKTRGRAYPGNHQDAAAQPEAIAPSQSAHTTPRVSLSTDSGACFVAPATPSTPRDAHSAGAVPAASTNCASPQPDPIPAAGNLSSTEHTSPQENPLPGHSQCANHFSSAGQFNSRAGNDLPTITHAPAKPIPAASDDAPTRESPPQETQPDGGHSSDDTHTIVAAVGTIVEQHRRRWDLIRARQRLELQAQAVCRRLNDGDKAKAAKLWAAVKKDETHELRAWLGPWLMAMQPLLDEQGKTEKYLAKLVKRLPVYEWVKGVSGLGDVSFSAIVGECAAPVGEYKSPSAVWKRMGLAVIGGERQRRIAGEAAIEHGYNCERRAIMWNIGDGLIKAQVRQVKDAEGNDTGERITLGEYGALYLERKAYVTAKNEAGDYGERKGAVDGKITPAHIHNDSKRYMEKRLLKNLWRAWRGNGEATAISGPSGNPSSDSPAEIQEAL